MLVLVIRDSQDECPSPALLRLSVSLSALAAQNKLP